MQFIDIGSIGTAANPSQPWISLGLPPTLEAAARVLSEAAGARPVQAQAAAQGVFLARRNVLVTAPTNSGKTLVGLLVLCEALARGQRAVLLAPLRALAQEKADDLKAKQARLARALGVPVRVVLSTGDYRLEGETFADPAPGGELLIATPERLESILRLANAEAWLAGVGAVCVDEAHLLGDPQRGPTLEYLLTSLLTAPKPPRLALLSATLGEPQALAHWLRPCDVITVRERTPPLEKLLRDLGEGEDANAAAAHWLHGELQEPAACALVFIHQARQTATTAATLGKLLGPLAGPAGAQSYHAQMPPAQRRQVRELLEQGATRVVVTTSALALGVNLPATHVVVRDLTYPGARSPGVAEILQMAGRAGRGDRAGRALVLKRSSDRWQLEELTQALRQEALPPLTSTLAAGAQHARSPAQAPAAAQAVATQLLRAGEAGRTTDELRTFFDHSFGGSAIAGQVRPSLAWLTQQLLGFTDESSARQRLTRLGEATVRSVLPLPVGAGFGRLLRDLLSLDEDAQTLGRWTPLDFLIVLELLSERGPSLRRYSAELAELVPAWCEGRPQQVPMLFRRWLRGAKGHSGAAEVLGSLGVEPRERVADRDEWARQRGLVATFNAIVLHERAMGRPVKDLERQFGVSNLEGVEERWRDNMIWLLGGAGRLLDVRCFFFHLKQDCEAKDERIRGVKQSLARMRWLALELTEQLKYASPLGGLLLAMKRRGQRGVGVESIRKLESLGVSRPDHLATMGLDGLVAAGVRRSIAKKLLAHTRAAKV